MPGYAPVVLAKLFADATPNDEFIAGPSGFGYAYPSAIDQKNVFADQTQTVMAKLGLHSVIDLDLDGQTGFSNAVIDALTAKPAVSQVFFGAINGLNQPSPKQVLWSNGKPVFPVYVVFRRHGQANQTVASNAAAVINALSTDDTSPAAYTLVYLDLWSITMHDVAALVGHLGPNVEVVRPDVLGALASRNISH
jgi:hypothetical protein